MGNKGGLGHLKRLPAPSFWPIHRKEAEWAPKPNPGAHKSVSCLPIGVIVRDSLGIAKTHQEVARILSQGKVKIDGRTRHEENYPVGLMDVIELADANIAYRDIAHREERPLAYSNTKRRSKIQTMQSSAEDNCAKRTSSIWGSRRQKHNHT